MSSAAYGTQLTRNGVAVALITNIGGPGLSADPLEVTNHDSPDGFKEYIPGLKDGGELSLEGNFNNSAGQAALIADLKAGTIASYVITFPNSLAWSLEGFVTAFETTAPVEDKIGFSATIKVTSVPVIDATYSTGLTTPFFVISESAVVVPVVAGDVYSYVATVLTGVTSVTVTPTATAGVIKVNGTTVLTGQASGAITLGAAGTITPITITVQESGKLARTYTVSLARAAS